MLEHCHMFWWLYKSQHEVFRSILHWRIKSNFPINIVMLKTKSCARQVIAISTSIMPCLWTTQFCVKYLTCFSSNTACLIETVACIYSSEGNVIVEMLNGKLLSRNKNVNKHFAIRMPVDGFLFGLIKFSISFITVSWVTSDFGSRCIDNRSEWRVLYFNKPCASLILRVCSMEQHAYISTSIVEKEHNYHMQLK